MSDIADKIYAATGLTLNAEAAAKIGQMIQQARRDGREERMTDTNNGWPGKPGVPLNPEKDGWHWVVSFDAEKTIVFWHGENQGNEGYWDGYPLWIAQDWTYLGPVLSHDQATALQARAAKLKRLVEILMENDPDDMAADAVTVLDVWRKEASAALEGWK